MTHSLHRRGSRESLSRDFVVLSCSAKGFNNHNYAEFCRKFMQICLKHNPVNFGDMKTGNWLYIDPQEIIERISNNTIVEITYDSKENVISLMKELKEADLGISVVISGISEIVDEIAREAGLGQVHTREYSLGTHGKTERLPEWEILEFHTMCGHAMVSPELIKKMIMDVKLGRKTPHEATVVMGKCCSCGNFNIPRSIELLEANLPLWTIDDPVY